jgi:NitT/TauT family transport system substrate-binding protein
MKWLSAFLMLVCLGFPAVAAEFRVGVMPAKESLPFYAEERLGIFKKHGITLVIVPFRSALERDSAFEAGKIDGAINDIVGTVLLAQSGRNVKILRTMARPRKDGPGFRIMKGMAPEDRNEIAISSNTVIEYVTDRILEGRKETQHLRKTEIKSVPLRMQLLLEGKVGYAVVAEPLASYLALKGASTLATDEKVRGSQVLFVARGDLAEGLLRSVVTAYDEASLEANRRKSDLKGLLWKRLALPPDLEEKYILPDLSVKEVPAKADVDDVLAWMRAKRLLKEPLPYDQLVYR